MMKGSTRLRVTMAVATALTACVLPLDVTIEHHEDGAVEGAGPVVTESWAVSGFHAVHVRGVGEVVVTKTGQESLAITGEENILAELDVEVRGGVLHLGPRPGVDLHPKRDLVFDVEVAELDEIEASGAVSFDASIGEEETLFATLSGACVLEATGAVDVLNVQASGVSFYGGKNLSSRLATLSTSGVAGAVVWATERLTATASGVSYIRYVGSPDLSLSVSGLATVKPY